MALEQRLAAVEMRNPEGDEAISNENNRKWKAALLGVLIDKESTLLVTGGGDRCSGWCLDEDKQEEGVKYKLLDASRFQLHACPHATRHVQCIITFLVANGVCHTDCPIMDSPLCRWTKSVNGKMGKAHLWAPEDYHNFAKAFLRNKVLTDAFLRPGLR